MRTDFDAIVIGSGIGGLAFASLLAQLRDARVLVLERHYALGGFTHAFSRPGGLHWDVGLHYVGDMGRAHRTRRLMELATGGAVEWRELPDPFEKYFYPGLTVTQPVGGEAYQCALSELWPSERDHLRRYFAELEMSASWLISRFAVAADALPRFLATARSRLALATTQSVLDSHFRDPELKAVLASQWGNYGLPPARSAFAAHALIAAHYLKGGWFPAGGGRSLTNALVQVIESRGGACLVRHEVKNVIVRNGAACGVRVRLPGRMESHAEFSAPLIASDAGARATYERLLNEDGPILERIRADLNALPPGYAVVQLFVELTDSPARFGSQGENHWFFQSYDHDAMFAARNELMRGTAGGAYLSFAGLTDARANRHTAAIIAPVDAEAFRVWSAQPWLRRAAEYEAVKQTISEALLDLVERYHPGFKARVSYHELATPLSVEHFTGHPDGAIYGLPPVAERFAVPWLGPRTPVNGLVLTGADAAIHGIVGALLGAVSAVATVLGPQGLQTIMRAAS